MICTLRKKGRLYSARVRLDGWSHPRYIALGVSDKQVAQQKLTELIRKFERQAVGILPSDAALSGRTFNRECACSMVHVINFQMGQYPVGDYVIPGIRESLYGRFTVNLGIVLPCVRRIEGELGATKVYHEYHCTIRDRLGSIANDGKEVWWTIEPPYSAVSSELLTLLSEFGLPFLKRFSSYEDVLREFEKNGKLPFSNKGRSALIAAMVYHELQDRVAAADAFRQAKELPAKNSRFVEYVQAIENRCK